MRRREYLAPVLSCQTQLTTISVGMAKPPATEDVARTFLFLASDNFSGSTHGQLLHVDGGKMGSVQWMPDEIAARR